jgi:hypothetical protein
MKIAGFLLLLAGWGIVLAALVMLSAFSQRTSFILAGIAVEAVGLVLLFRTHVIPRAERG